jgi:hypothetical protein
LKIYIQGQEYARQAIQTDSRNPKGYYWLSSNLGRWGQTKGILDSLGKAGEMRDNLIAALRMDAGFADAFMVLGMLHSAVPGRPLSFGDKAASVSFARKSVDARMKEIASGKEEEMGWSIPYELANNLWERNWSQRKRENSMKNMLEDYNSTNDVFEKNKYFEATVRIPQQSDREEAAVILKKLIRDIEAKPSKTAADLEKLEECRALAEEWKI